MRGRVPARQRRDHGQRLLPAPEITADRLARRTRVPPDAEEIVGELEGQAEVHAEPPQPLDMLVGAAAGPGAERAGDREQRSGLVAGHVQAFGQTDVRAPFEAEVGALAADQPQQRRAEPARAAPVVTAPGQFVEGERVQRVAGEDGVRGAEDRPHARPVPAHRVAVHDIVVQQREVVHKLDRHRGGQRAVGEAADRLRAQQYQRRPYALSGGRGGEAPMQIEPAEVIAGDRA